MKIVSAEDLGTLAPYRDLVEAMRQGFQTDVETPVRHQHQLSESATLLLMPAWTEEFTGLKTVVFNGDNAAKGLSTVQASYQLMSGETGELLALIDGTELTRRRTAAASALAADYLAKRNAKTLLMIGAGALCSHFVRAHASVRPLERVMILSRTLSKAAAVARDLRADGLDVSVTSDLEGAMAKADIVSCATTSTTPIVQGRWLKPGTHVDIAGAFKLSMREVDGETVARARVYVDTREGAATEASDLIHAQNEGKFDFASVQGDLFDLCRERDKGRKSPQEITLFKSCGTAIEDLAAAVMVYQRL